MGPSIWIPLGVGGKIAQPGGRKGVQFLAATHTSRRVRRQGLVLPRRFVCWGALAACCGHMCAATTWPGSKVTECSTSHVSFYLKFSKYWNYFLRESTGWKFRSIFCYGVTDAGGYGIVILSQRHFICKQHHSRVMWLITSVLSPEQKCFHTTSRLISVMCRVVPYCKTQRLHCPVTKSRCYWNGEWGRWAEEMVCRRWVMLWRSAW